MKTPPKKNTRGPQPGQGGRPKGPEKVKLTCQILPETMAAIKAQGLPGAVIDQQTRKLAWIRKIIETSYTQYEAMEAIAETLGMDYFKLPSVKE